MTQSDDDMNRSNIKSFTETGNKLGANDHFFQLSGQLSISQLSGQYFDIDILMAKDICGFNNN